MAKVLQDLLAMDEAVSMAYKVGWDFVCGVRVPNSVYWVISKIAVKFNGIELPFRVLCGCE